nr:MAG TPA: hypothetical protein [Caudoviricetes sp.]DAX72733.1 MAG TPA: hypothetical protein [Caudoviricetes sp.]
MYFFFRNTPFLFLIFHKLTQTSLHVIIAL